MASFRANSFIPKGLSSSFITLIPKQSHPSKVTDFQSIRLMNSSMKLLTKLLAERLKRALPSLIPEEQNDFCER